MHFFQTLKIGTLCSAAFFCTSQVMAAPTQTSNTVEAERVEKTSVEKTSVGKKSTDAQALVALLADMNSIKGSFAQTITDADGSVLQATKGTYKIKRPGFLHWETLPPYEQIIISNSQRLWVYDPDLEQVTIHSAQHLDKGPADILNGDLNEINQQYVVNKILPSDAVPKKQKDASANVLESRVGFTLTPINVDVSSFAQVTIWFQNENLSLIEMLDKLSQITLIQFSDTTLNAEMNASEFVFTPPQDIDIIIAN